LSKVGLPRSSWYYQSKSKQLDRRRLNKGRPASNFCLDVNGKVINDEIIIGYLKAYRDNKFFRAGGGYKKLHYYLKRTEGVIVNHKKLYRLCKENNLLLPRIRKHKHFRLMSCNRKITKPNQVWEFDIKYGYLAGENKHFFILVYIDVFSRMIMGAYIGLTCKAHNLVATLSFALRKWQVSEQELIIRSDNGPQMTSKALREYLEGLEDSITHEFIPCATPNKDAHVEAFYSIIEMEFLRVHVFKYFEEAYEEFYEFIEFYNEGRVHGSLGYRTPKEIMDLYASGSYIKLPKTISI